MVNGVELPRKQQIIKCGSVVRLDEAVEEHGVLFIHPELPPIRLHVQVDKEKHTISHYAWEIIAPEHGKQTQFAVHVHEVGHNKIMTQPSRIITPGNDG